MSCDKHFADALTDDTEGCPACESLLTQSKRVAAQLSALPRHAPPASVWQNLSGILLAGRRRRQLAVLSNVFTGLAAALLLWCLIQPLVSSPPDTPEARTDAPRAQLEPDPEPELRLLRGQAGVLTLLAGADY